MAELSAADAKYELEFLISNSEFIKYNPSKKQFTIDVSSYDKTTDTFQHFERGFTADRLDTAKNIGSSKTAFQNLLTSFKKLGATVVTESENVSIVTESKALKNTKVSDKNLGKYLNSLKPKDVTIDINNEDLLNLINKKAAELDDARAVQIIRDSAKVKLGTGATDPFVSFSKEFPASGDIFLVNGMSSGLKDSTRIDSFVAVCAAFKKLDCAIVEDVSGLTATFSANSEKIKTSQIDAATFPKFDRYR